MNRKPLFPFMFLIVAILASGCAAPKMYYWGDYSKSLHNCRKNTSEENLLKHKQVLENIIEESNKNNMRVPPGVYAELGYIYFRQNKNKDAVIYFGLEEHTYPESKIFMQRMVQAARAREGDSSSADDQTPVRNETKIGAD